MAAALEDTKRAELKEMLSSTYVSLDFDQETRDMLRREQCCCQESSRKKSVSQTSRSKLFDFFKCKRRKDKDMSCDDIFYTASSRSPLEFRAIGVKMAVASTPDNDREGKKCCRCLFDPIIKCPFISWFIIAFGILIYVFARCLYQKDFIHFWQTTEGHIVLSLEIIIIIFGIYMVWNLMDYNSRRGISRTPESSA